MPSLLSSISCSAVVISPGHTSKQAHANHDPLSDALQQDLSVHGSYEPMSGGSVTPSILASARLAIIS
jgi:hypothetical protein